MFEKGGVIMDKKIEKLRLQLVQNGMKFGFLHPRVQYLSRKLDRMLNDWQDKEELKRSDRVREYSFVYRVSSL